MRMFIESTDLTDGDPFILCQLANGDELVIVNPRRQALLPQWMRVEHLNQLLATADQPTPHREQPSAEIISMDDLRARREASTRKANHS